MKLKCYATGSNGNFYILENNRGKQLVLELGIKYIKIITKINYDKTQAILITHNHSDHNFKDNDLKFSNLNIPIIKAENVILNKPLIFGDKDFIVIPLKAYHNVNCVSYLIRCDNKTILFATDTNKITKVSCQIDYLICEVNHIQQNIIDLTMYDYDNEYTHLVQSFKNHHSLEEMENYLQSLNYKPKKLIVIHWSHTKAFDKEKVISTLSKYVEEPIEIAKKGEYIL